MAMNIQVRGFKIRMVNVYSPTNCDGSENEKDTFYRMLKKSCNKQHKQQKLVVVGDFNATTAVSLDKNYFDGQQIINDSICNDNGSRLKNICRELRLCMSQTYFDHPKEKRYTWHSGDGNTVTRVLPTANQ
jgi:exonuclease III